MKHSHQNTPKIAIIGAGFSGLVLGQALKDVASITIFEKARGVGGRMSTRYAAPFYFDHGAQCFTARTKAFQGFIRPLIEAGHVSEWKGKVINLEVGKKDTKRIWFETHLVGSPNMNSLCKVLEEGLDVRLNTEVAPPAKTPQGWQLTSTKGDDFGQFDWIISTAPPAQTLTLFSDHIPAGSVVHQAKMQGCYALMLGFNKPRAQVCKKTWIAAKVRNNPIKWISLNSSKPGRDDSVTCFVAHSRSSWAEEHMNADMDWAQAELLREFSAVTGIDASAADYISTHRWRYAIVDEGCDLNPYCDPQTRLASVSDWCQTSRIEEVWLAAKELEQHLRQAL